MTCRQSTHRLATARRLTAFSATCELDRTSTEGVLDESFRSFRPSQRRHRRERRHRTWHSDELGSAGSAVCIWGRNPKKNARATEIVSRTGSDCASIVCDVGDPVSVEAAMEQTLDRFKRVDGCFARRSGERLAPLTTTMAHRVRAPPICTLGYAAALSKGGKSCFCFARFSFN
jgi:hypothetical protein